MLSVRNTAVVSYLHRGPSNVRPRRSGPGSQRLRFGGADKAQLAMFCITALTALAVLTSPGVQSIGIVQRVAKLISCLITVTMVLD